MLIVFLIFGTKNHEKIVKKGFQNNAIFWIDFWRVLGTILGPSWEGFGRSGAAFWEKNEAGREKKCNKKGKQKKEAIKRP